MKFKKMEIYGFKSFADKVQVKFESGVTGIVGPNGCGKSNVADSIRWVLGEQSAKALRGSTMQDVIFNGTEKRKPQSFAEVSLYFDNTEKIFACDYDEVVLTRKLYRSGESGYAINKTPCRLKDIAELLRDSGVGRESYSIIGQGRIDELLSAKPEDRRAVFEEAAGISKLKNRKAESLKRLNNTKENLIRIDDILHELEIQIDPLTKQAETAKKYLEYKERLKTLEVNNYIYQYDSSSSSKEEITNRLNGINEEINLKTSEFDKTVEDYGQTSGKIAETDSEIERLRDELLTLTVGLEKQAGESRLLQEKITTLGDTKTRLTGLIDALNVNLSELKDALNKNTDTKKLKTIVLEELTKKIEESSTILNETTLKISTLENKSEEETQKLVENLGKLGDIKAQISSLRAEIKALEDRELELSKAKEQNGEKFDGYMKEYNEIDAAVKKLCNQKSAKIEEQKEEKQNNLKLAYKQAAIEDDIKDLIGSMHSLTSKVNLLKEMQKENDGYQASIKRILQDAKNNTTLAGKFVNVVARLMKVPEKYETAIDMALGSSVQNIVTKNENDAKFVIEYLKANNIGRATFLPITSMKPRRINDEAREIISKTPKVCGVADELVLFDKEYANVFSSLLGSTVIVEDMTVAVQVAKATRYSFKIVTLEGDVISPSGTMSGGSKKVLAVSLIGREREIADAEKQIKEIVSRKEQKEKELEDVKKQQELFDKKLEEFDASIHEIDLEIAKENESLVKFNELMMALKDEEDQENETLLALKENKKALTDRLNAFTKYENDLNSGKIEEGATKNPELYLLKQKRDSETETLTELKVKRASAESELVSVDAETLRINDEIDTVNEKIKQARLEMQQCLKELGNNENQFASVVDKKAYQANVDKLQGVRDKLASYDTIKKNLSNKLASLAEQKLVLSNEIQRANDRKFKEESALIKIDSDIEVMQERVWEEYGLTYTTALEYKVENHNIEEGLQESAKLKKQIAGLGNVNVNAIESLNDVSERFKDLNAQRDDLVNAEQDLTKIIDSLTSEMEGKFKIEFNKINNNFQGVFRELFGGGRAELRLTDPDNCLECGIDIAAEPTGKKLQNITLLSGGERALTAIAILFAILKLRPMPFCVLDEIEAALDDANVERFAKYLKRFSSYTQFIVITHRKPTMELADTLYGVTMEERGVSKVVSVQLSEAIKHTSKEN